MHQQQPMWPKGVKLKPALEQAIAAIKTINAPAAANKAGCDQRPGAVIVPFFNKTYEIQVAEGKVVEAGTTVSPSWPVQLMVLHYLVNADGTPPAGMWVTFRHVPDGMVFESNFNASAVQPLVQAFGSDIEGFRRACESVGGIAMSRTGDASYRFMALPQVPMGIILNLADEELAATISILFDANVSNYFCTEDTVYLGMHLSELLLREKR